MRTKAKTGAHSPAAYAAHLHLLRKRIAKLRGRFTVVVQRPFVVIGDGPRRQVHAHARDLVRRTVNSLKRAFFARDPQRILDVWLFSNRQSYRENARRLTGQSPGTPFGFYSSAHGALIMNIATGGGTLIHEIVHPYVEANFPNCPPWFNEGLGSLFEAAGWPGGRIRGYLNWRLPGLKRAIAKGKVPSFAILMSRNEVEFYDHDPGTNYSQARYLLFYLQQRGLLRKYYHAFRHAHPRTDPTGLATLKKVLRTTNLEAFERRWRRYVLGLRWER